MLKQTYPKEFLALCASVTAKRPKTVIDHIVKHGQITTEDLKNTCGLSCYWAYPENHQHVAMKQMRRVDVAWQGEETAEFDAVKQAATAAGKTPADFIKEAVRAAIFRERAGRV